MKNLHERIDDIQVYQSFHTYLINEGNKRDITEEEYRVKLQHLVHLTQQLLDSYDNNKIIKNIISREDLLKIGLVLDDVLIEYKENINK